MNETRRILVTAPKISNVDRELLRGILAYARGKKGTRWQVDLDFGDRDCCPIPVDPGDYDGFISLVSDPKQRGDIRHRRKPSVLIEDVLTPRTFSSRPNVVTIANDHESEGCAAANYFLARHFRNFAWYGEESEPDWSAGRHRGFAGRLRTAGFRCLSFTGNADGLPSWLKSLPKPCAVFAVYDLRARRLVDTAVRSGIDVPRELAVLGVDNDDIICTTSFPTLSSIPSVHHSIGQAAGRALNELMLGRAKGGRVMKVRYTRIISRLSTDIDAISDPALATALTYSRNHLFSKLDTAALARQAGCPKYRLQASAMKTLGHPLADEIRKLRLNTARELLSETDTPIAEIAEACGYNSVSHLSLRIKEACGLTPLAYRRKFRQFTTR